jgi:hypothetical protein
MRHPDTEIDAALSHVRKLWHALMKRNVSVEDDLVKEYSKALNVLYKKGHLARAGLQIEQVQIPDWWIKQRVVINREIVIAAGNGSGTFWGNLEFILRRGWWTEENVDPQL